MAKQHPSTWPIQCQNLDAKLLLGLDILNFGGLLKCNITLDVSNVKEDSEQKSK
jgi:hypothetical protein